MAAGGDHCHRKRLPLGLERPASIQPSRSYVFHLRSFGVCRIFRSCRLISQCVGARREGNVQGLLQTQKQGEEASATMRIQPLVEHQSLLAAMPTSAPTQPDLKLENFRCRHFGPANKKSGKGGCGEAAIAKASRAAAADDMWIARKNTPIESSRHRRKDDRGM